MFRISTTSNNGSKFHSQCYPSENPNLLILFESETTRTRVATYSCPIASSMPSLHIFISFQHFYRTMHCLRFAIPTEAVRGTAIRRPSDRTTNMECTSIDAWRDGRLRACRDGCVSWWMNEWKQGWRHGDWKRLHKIVEI